MDAILSVLESIAVALFGGTVGSETITGAVPTFWNFITGPEVLPYFLIGVGVSLLLLAVRVVKSVFWGV